MVEGAAKGQTNHFEERYKMNEEVKTANPRQK